MASPASWCARAALLLVSVAALAGQRQLAWAQDTIDWCAAATDAAADGTVYEAYFGEETCIPLCVAKSSETSTNGNLDIVAVTEESPGTYPTGTTFQYPYNEINFPASASIKEVASTDTDPLKREFCFTPEHGEECSYSVCFTGTDLDTSTNTSVRCYKVEVYNSVLEFAGNEETSVPDLSKHIAPSNGFSMAAWVYPKCRSLSTEFNQTIMYFGSERNEQTALGLDTGLEVRNAIKYITYANGTATFFYYDHYKGAVFADNKYCCDKWHYVGVSIGEDNSGFLFVDGASPRASIQGSRDTVKYDVKAFETAARPDNNMDGDGKGTFKVGHYEDETYMGFVDEISVFDEALSSADMEANMMKRSLLVGAPASLKAYFTMRDGLGGYTFPLADAVGNSAGMIRSSNTAGVVKKAIPTMVPCVLGMQHSVGPSDGACPTDVYGWSIADGLVPACSFGGRLAKGVYVDDFTIKCDTPGHVSPRFVDVLASNDAGAQFTTDAVGKDVKHLYMESSLYVDGTAGGAEADGVCTDLPSRAVTFGGWFCPKCGPPATS